MNGRELAAVLTGLRILQSQLEDHGEPLGENMDLFTDGAAVTPLAAAEIGELRMKLNTSPEGDAA